MACWDLRILSLIVAWLHTVGSAIVALSCLILLCCINSDFMKEIENYDEIKGPLLVGLGFGLVLSCLSFAICAMLIVGINQDRTKLMSPYVYLACIGIVLGLLGLVAQFIMQLVDKQTFGEVFLGFFRNLLYVAFEVLLFSPIYLLYKKMRSGPLLPEHHGLSNNEPVHKPLYVHSGHI